MKRAMVILAGSVVLVVGAVAHADQKIDQKFCAGVATFESDMAVLNSMGPHSTVAELRTATDRVDSDVKEMQKTADKMKTPTAKAFTDSMNQLKRDVGVIPDDATLEQVRAKIQNDVQNARASGRTLAAESGCPVTIPPQP